MTNVMTKQNAFGEIIEARKLKTNDKSNRKKRDVIYFI